MIIYNVYFQHSHFDLTLKIAFLDFPRVSVGPYNPLMVEEGDTAAMLCEVRYV